MLAVKSPITGVDHAMIDLTDRDAANAEATHVDCQRKGLQTSLVRGTHDPSSSNCQHSRISQLPWVGF